MTKTELQTGLTEMAAQARTRLKPHTAKLLDCAGEACSNGDMAYVGYILGCVADFIDVPPGFTSIRSMVRLADSLTDQSALTQAVKAIIPDLEHYVATHGPGPDRRLDTLKTTLNNGN